MKYFVCAVRDAALNAFNRPFFSPSRGIAQRSFGDEVNRSGSEMHGHPEDYELWCFGEWDDEGEFLLNGRERIVRALDVVKGGKDVS